MAIGKFLAPLNGQTLIQNKPYVDDIFDPLFNHEVTEYYRNLYGPLAIPAGYAAMLDNALTGKKGILGPGMGILSTFGRSMDKADDFILGGLTEGVNALGQITGGTNQAPTNPIKNIFVNDYDYQGTKLMAAAGNAMARLAGTQTPLDETDFQSLGDKIAGTTIDLATDPGIMGSQLARLNKGTAVGKMGEILNNYDDVVANVAGNMAFPGAKAMIGKGLTRIRDFLGANSSTSPVDMAIKTNPEIVIFDPATGDGTFTNLNPETLDNLRLMSSDIANASALNPITTPNEYAVLEDINGLTSYISPEEFQQAQDAYLKQQAAIADFRNKKVSSLATKQMDYENKVKDELFNGINDNPTWFNLKLTKGMGPDFSDIVYTEPMIEELYDSLNQDEFINLIEDNLPGDELSETGKFRETLRHYVDDELDLDEAKRIYKDYLSQKPKSYTTPFNFSQSASGINSLVGSEKLDLLNLHLAEFLSKHPEGFNLGYLQKNIDPEIYIPIKKMDMSKAASKSNPRTDFFEQARQFTRGYQLGSKGYKKLPKDLPAGNLTSLLKMFKEQHIDIPVDELEGTITAEGLIPWIRNNETLLNKTKYGRDLITLADNLDTDIFSNELINESTDVYGLGTTESLSKIVNSIFDSGVLKTKEDMEKFAQTFPNFELTLNPSFKGTEYEELYKHYQDFRKTHKLYGSKWTTFTPVDVAKRATKILKEPNLVSIKSYSDLSNGLATFTPKDFSKTITSNYSIQDDSALDVLEDTFASFKQSWAIPDDIPLPQLEGYIRTVGSREEKTLFQLWNAATGAKVKNKLQMDHGALHVKVVQDSKTYVDNLVKKYKPDELSKKVSEYITKKDIEEGAKLYGDTFLEDLWAAKGFQEIPLPTKYPKVKQDAIAKAIKQNVDNVNKYGNILKFVDVVEEDGTRRLAVCFDVDNIYIKKDLNKIYSLFGKKDLGLTDVVLRDQKFNKFAWDTSEFDTAFAKIREGSESLATRLGYEKFSDNYISHVMKDSEEATKTFNGIYKSLGINKDKLDKICQALQDQDIASGKLQFGAIPMRRSHLGAFGQYKDGFETDLAKIHSATFTQGMMDNTNAQTYFDLFLSDNFNIKNNFDNVETLKKALNASDGNLNNLSLVKPRYNESGKLIGFSRYNKFSDASLTQAYNDPDAILVPDSVIGSLDRICKKDARMSSKVYRFINKYLTVPFKFGTLANPGFLAGNIQDAYFKQAVELSKKYGTSLDEELTNVAMSMRHVTQLNNNFSQILEDYRTWLKNTDLKTITRSDKPVDWYNETFKYSKASIDTLTAERICNDPKFHNAFREYVNTHVPVEKRKLANFYLFLNNNQTSTMFNKDLQDLADMTTNNPYNVPNNIVERIFYGDPSTKFAKDTSGKMVEIQRSGINSYGLFLNNPVSNKILKSSNTIENWMRSSTIINDLQHQGYDIDKICNILDLDPVTEKATRTQFKMSMNEAIATMHAANFDYDNVSEFMNKVSYILPFPTFYLKNLAFWADIFTNKPQMIDNAISVHEGLWSGKDTKDEFVAEAKGRGAVPIGQQKGIKHLTGIVKQTPYNSMFGAFGAINDFREDFTYRTNPILRPLARHLQNPEDVKYRPYNTNQYQKNIKMGDKEFSNLAYMFHQLNPYERFISTGLRTPGKVSRNEYQLSDFLPSMVQPDFSKK